MPPHLQAALDSNQEEEQKRKENKPQEEHPADAHEEGREEQNQGLQEEEGEKMTAAGQVDPPLADEQVQENPAGYAVGDQQQAGDDGYGEHQQEGRETASAEETQSGDHHHDSGHDGQHYDGARQDTDHHDDARQDGASQDGMEATSEANSQGANDWNTGNSLEHSLEDESVRQEEESGQEHNGYLKNQEDGRDFQEGGNMTHQESNMDMEQTGMMSESREGDRQENGDAENKEPVQQGANFGGDNNHQEQQLVHEKQHLQEESGQQEQLQEKASPEQQFDLLGDMGSSIAAE